MRSYSPELKAQVVAEWLTGATQNGLASKYKIPRPTVIDWVRKYPRQVVIPQPDLAEAFAMSVYSRTMEALDALGAHLRAAAKPEFAGTVEGWTDRAAGLVRTAVTLGAAIQRGQSEPIAIPERVDVSG